MTRHCRTGAAVCMKRSHLTLPPARRTSKLLLSPKTSRATALKRLAMDQWACRTSFHMVLRLQLVATDIGIRCMVKSATMAMLSMEMGALQAVNVRMGCRMVTAPAPNHLRVVAMVLHRHAILASMVQSGSRAPLVRCLRPRLRVGGSWSPSSADLPLLAYGHDQTDMTDNADSASDASLLAVIINCSVHSSKLCAGIQHHNLSGYSTAFEQLCILLGVIDNFQDATHR